MIGKVIRIAEDDYCYGLGTLTLRVTGVAQSHDPRWVRVRGVEIRWDLADGDTREVLVRRSALPRKP